jgi:hypothetical protein
VKLRLSLLKAAFSRDPMSGALMTAYLHAQDAPSHLAVLPSNSGYDSPCCGICDDCGSILRDRTA